MMWLVSEYQIVGLFSLKHSLATSSGAKSLLVPTPYAIKMGLVDAACRAWGLTRARMVWPTVRDLQVALRPPRRAVVTNLFAKILKPRRSAAGAGSADVGPLGRTIAFREYVWTDGGWGLALGPCSPEQETDLVELLLQINYLGKRGGFVQLTGIPEAANTLPEGFVVLNPLDGPVAFDSRGLPQVLDDCGPNVAFDAIDIYSGKGLKLGRDRILCHVVLPYYLKRSSRSYSLYERLDE